MTSQYPPNSGEPADLISYLPARVWYLSQSGADMWCRRPYGFFFSSSEAALAFALAFEVALELAPVGIDAKELISDEGLTAMRSLHITRIFVDPTIDSDTGDVFGTILRLAEMN